MAELYIVCGAPGMGKSPFVRKLIEGRACFIFDIANEYGTRVKYPGQQPIGLTNNTNEIRSRYIGVDVNQFVKLAGQKRKTIVVFEEATGFFRGMVQQDTVRLIIGRFHSQNTYVFIFHSINSIPPRIMEIATITVLFKTLDESHKVATKYSRLLEAYTYLQTKPNGENVILKML